MGYGTIMKSNSYIAKNKGEFPMIYQDSTKNVFKMSIPIFIELLLQLLVGNVDQIMISRYSQGSVAAIGNGNQIMSIVIIFLNVMSVSTTILISRYLGAQDKRKINEVCNVSLLMLGIVALLATLIIFIGHNSIFVWMKVPADILGEASQYLTVVAICILAQGFYMVLASILRSFGLMKEVMYVAAIMNIINIIGNTLLINGLFGFPQLGILGAAISTNISKCIGLILIFALFRKNIAVELSFKYLRPFPKETLKNLLKIGLPSGGEELSYNLSQVYIFKFINLFGTAIIATKVYCSLLANVSYVYSIALANATQIMVSYLMGAMDLEKVRKRVWTTTGISMIIALSITGIIYINSDWIFRIFTSDPAIISLGKKIILIEFFLEIGRTVNIVMTKCLVAVGDVMFPVITGIIFMWFVAVLFSYIVGVRMGYGLIGIWIVMTIDESLRGIIFILRFRSKKWEKKLAPSPQPN